MIIQIMSNVKRSRLETQKSMQVELLHAGYSIRIGLSGFTTMVMGQYHSVQPLVVARHINCYVNVPSGPAHYTHDY